MSATKRAAEDAADASKETKRAAIQSSFIKIEDDFAGYALEMLRIPHHYQDDLERVLLPHGIIIDRINKMAHNIFEEFKEEPLTVLCVLKGGHQFFADLFEAIKELNTFTQKPVPLAIDFIRVKSYEGTESTGKVQVLGGDSLDDIKDKNVLIVEDMIDTGTTMVKLLATLTDHKPKTLRVASLFVKRTPRSNGYKPDFTGFEVPDHFVVGYALDYNEHFRDLNHICILNDQGKKKYA